MSAQIDDVEQNPERLAQRFPGGFRWGFAASAYQIEGAVTEDGRGASIWDTFSHTPGRTANGDTGDVACDHYHRYRDDVAMMAELGAKAYRFSVSWPRIFPTGSGAPNHKGIDFYRRLVDELVAAGIEPTLNLFHWDLPQALQDKGGFASRDIVGWFADYAHLVATKLGDSVSNWMTFNEPAVYAFLGHADGFHAPGVRDWPTAMRVADNEIRAHGAAAAAIRSEVANARIGVAVDLNHFAPATDSDDDVQAAREARAARDEWFLDPLFGRGYPKLGLQAHEAAGHLDGVRARDAASRRPRLRRGQLLPPGDGLRELRPSVRLGDSPTHGRRTDRDALGSRAARPVREPHVGAPRLPAQGADDHRERRSLPGPGRAGRRRPRHGSRALSRAPPQCRGRCHRGRRATDRLTSSGR